MKSCSTLAQPAQSRELLPRRGGLPRPRGGGGGRPSARMAWAGNERSCDSSISVFRSDGSCCARFGARKSSTRLGWGVGRGDDLDHIAAAQLGPQGAASPLTWATTQVAHVGWMA